MAQPAENLLLEAYARQSGTAFLSQFEPTPMPFKARLYSAGERPRHVHFMTTGAASLVALLEEGAEVEVSMTGNEGFPEAIHLLGPEASPRNCTIQVQGTALRMPIKDFEKVFHEDAVLRGLVLRFVQFQALTSSQLIACNGQHDAEQRLARWMLMVQDRVHDSDLPLTQEFLGQMLGARRSTVTIAASNLQRAGMIEYRRGQIKILDRERLADTACECYDMVRKLHNNLYHD